MKIGMILDDTFPPDPRVENEAIALVSKGHQVFLFCLGYNKVNESEIFEGIQVKRYRSNKLIYKLSALAYTFPFYRYLLQKKINHFLTFNKIEVIHIHDIRIAETVFEINKKLKLKIVLDLHENRPEIMKFYPHLNKFPGNFLINPKYWKKKEEEFVRKASKMIVVTEEAKQELLSRTIKNENDIIVVPNSVKESFYNNYNINQEIVNKYQTDFVLLYIGDTGSRRGLIAVVEALSKLNKIIKNIKLIVLGKVDVNSELFLASESNIKHNIELVGWKSPELFQTYIEISDICISPLHRNIHHDTTYANKLFQYMSFGKPVLVSNATAQKNLIEKTQSGLVHIEKNAEDFADKVLQLYHNKALANKLGANGKRFVEEEFCWEKVSSNLIKLYEELA